LSNKLGHDVYDHLDAKRHGDAYRGFAGRPSGLLPSRLGERGSVATQGTRRIREKHSAPRVREEGAPNGVAHSQRYRTSFARHEPDIKTSGRSDPVHRRQLEQRASCV